MGSVEPRSADDHPVSSLLPQAVVLAGSAMALWSWLSVGGLPRAPSDRPLVELLGPETTRKLDLVLSLVVVLLGVLATW